MGDDIARLQESVYTIHKLDKEDWDAFAACWKEVRINRKQSITAAGDHESHLYFVLEGVQRIFFLDEKEREATLLFTYTPSFGGVVDSLLLRHPSKYYYETLTPSRFLRISSADLFLLLQSRPAIETFVRKALTHSMSGLLERLVDLQTLNAEDKFKKLLHRSPHVLQLVPQKYLASYLGMDATNFSKLMNNVRI
jgi:CRP-like cAMP-binding protein